MPAYMQSIETYPALTSCEGIRHLFIRRIAEVEVQTDRETAIQRLEKSHHQILQEQGLSGLILATGEQVHGAEVGVIAAATPLPEFPMRSVDALVTNRRDICLGIYVADCAAVYLVDPIGGAIGLVHAGRKGAEAGIVARTIRTMSDAFGTKPGNLIAQISPCIRPPHYEIDFAQEILNQTWSAGVLTIEDCKTCTASDPSLYYSYRKEKGRTGRMLAILALKNE